MNQPDHYYVEDHEDGTLRANGNGGPPRTDKQPLIVTHALTSEGHDASEDGTGRGTPLTVVMRVCEACVNGYHPGCDGCDPTGAVCACPCGPDTPVGFHLTQDPIHLNGASLPLGHKSTGNGVMAGAAVRRLTPRECERLQGFPSDWTLIQWMGKPAPDSRRYAACGDAVTVPVAEWIGRRLAAAS